MESKHEFIDNPEFDEFFRRGEELGRGADTLQPVAGAAHQEELQGEFTRTPAQVQRRARFVKFVSATMVCLSIGSAGAFAHKAAQGRYRTVIASLGLQSQTTDSPAGPTDSRHQGSSLSSTLAEPPLHPGPSEAAQVQHVPHTNAPDSAPLAQQAATATTQPNPTTVSTQVAALQPSAATNPAVAAATSQPSASAASTQSNEAPTPAIAAVAAPAPPSADSTRAATEPQLLRGTTTPKALVSAAQRSKASVTTNAARSTVRMPQTKAATSKSIGPRPEGYRPPTTSFSD